MRALVQVQRVVQIHTGQNGEYIGLQPGDKHFKTGQADQRKKRQYGSGHGDAACPGNHHGKSGKDFEHRVACEHIGKKSNRKADRTNEIGNHLNDDEERDQHLRRTGRHKEAEEMCSMLDQGDQRHTDEDESCKDKCHHDL